MTCDYFGICGSCNLGGKSYEEQLNIKIEKEKERFKEFDLPTIDIIKSDDGSFRNRAEFRIWKTYDENNNPKLNYAMNDLNKKALPITSCSIVSDAISSIMPRLLESLSKSELLNFKLFSCEFLSSTTNDTLVTLIYHKKLELEWETEAKKIEKELNIKIIGRSRKQKVVLSEDHITDTLTINGKNHTFQYFEGGFTQPNQKVNAQMIEWAINNSEHTKDLCELYCGGGNFTIPFSKYFNKVLATEISKTSIRSAKINCKLNNVDNIKFIRMSSEEFVEALNDKREFRRLKQEDVDLKDYSFYKNSPSYNQQPTTIFVDPPRAGLDETTTKLCSKFEQIIYISCNPETLHRDLLELKKTHSIKHFAFFDQFAYSNHIESGAILYKS